MTLVIYLMLSTFSDVCWIDACMHNVSTWAVPAKREWKQVKKKKIVGKTQPSVLYKKNTYMPKKYAINPYDKEYSTFHQKTKVINVML